MSSPAPNPRGMALQRILRDDDTDRRRVFEVWKRLMAVVLGQTSVHTPQEETPNE